MTAEQVMLAKCKFCGRIFKNKQAVKAHLKGCIANRQRLPRQNERKAIRVATTATPAVESQMRSEPNLEHNRNKIIMAVINEAIERDCGLRYGIPQELKAQAIMEIRQELSPLCLDDFTFNDLLETAEGIRDSVYYSVLQTLDAPTRQEMNHENVARRRREELRRTLERMEEEVNMERQRTARVASAVQYAERQLADAPGMGIWNRLSAMQEVRNSLGREVTGPESLAHIEKSVDDLLLPFLSRIVEKVSFEIIEFVPPVGVYAFASCL